MAVTGDGRAVFGYSCQPVGVVFSGARPLKLAKKLNSFSSVASLLAVFSCCQCVSALPLPLSIRLEKSGVCVRLQAGFRLES